MRVTAIDSYKCGNERHRRVARSGAEHELCKALFPSIIPNCVMTDFETALQNAFFFPFGSGTVLALLLLRPPSFIVRDRKNKFYIQ